MDFYLLFSLTFSIFYKLEIIKNIILNMKICKKYKKSIFLFFIKKSLFNYNNLFKFCPEKNEEFEQAKKNNEVKAI